MTYGQVDFHDFDIISLSVFALWVHICSSLLWSVGNSVLQECQEGRPAHLGVRVVPSLEPSLFQLLSLPVDEVSVLFFWTQPQWRTLQVL